MGIFGSTYKAEHPNDVQKKVEEILFRTRGDIIQLKDREWLMATLKNRALFLGEMKKRLKKEKRHLSAPNKGSIMATFFAFINTELEILGNLQGLELSERKEFAETGRKSLELKEALDKLRITLAHPDNKYSIAEAQAEVTKLAKDHYIVAYRDLKSYSVVTTGIEDIVFRQAA